MKRFRLNVFFKKSLILGCWLICLLINQSIMAAGLQQIVEIEWAQVPVESFEMNDFMTNRDAWRSQKILNHDSQLIKVHSINITSFKIPKYSQDRVVLRHMSNIGLNKYGYGDSVFVWDGYKFIRLHDLGARHVSFEIEKKFYGYELFVFSRTPYFQLYGPISFVIYSVEDFIVVLENERMMIGVIEGVVLIMSLYNLGMYILFRAKYLIFYIFYAVSFLYFYGFSSGLFPVNDLSLFLLLVSMPIFTISMLLFSTSVLEIGTKSKITNLIKIGLIAIICAQLVMVMLGSEFVIKSYILTAPPIFLFCFYIAFKAALGGYKPAYAMMLGWAGLLFAITLIAKQFMDQEFPSLHWAFPTAMAFEIATFSFAMGQKIRMSEVKIIKENQHAFEEMRKMVYPHQLNQIKEGASLETTMPTHEALACVLSFDIIGSSQINHKSVKEFLRNVFARCNEAMNEGYDSLNLKSKAYRIKEMGDGFLCSVGYPFESVSNNPAADAVDLAILFARILAEESHIINSNEPITCGIGIACERLTGFYPETGTKEYDLYGRGIILATRYEKLRKILFESEKKRSILIIQEHIHKQLDSKIQSEFQVLNIGEMGIVVRDDPAACRIFYRFIGPT